jgi:hypothetical protein
MADATLFTSILHNCTYHSWFAFLFAAALVAVIVLAPPRTTCVIALLLLSPSCTLPLVAFPQTLLPLPATHVRGKLSSVIGAVLLRARMYDCLRRRGYMFKVSPRGCSS